MMLGIRYLLATDRMLEGVSRKPSVVLLFKAAMYHPNIYNRSNIWLDSTILLINVVLQKECSSFYDLSDLLKSISSLLLNSPGSPAS